MTLRMNIVWELFHKLVVLLSSFISPYFEAKSIYMFRVPVWCLKYVVMCNCFAHVISVICKFVNQPGWGN